MDTRQHLSGSVWACCVCATAVLAMVRLFPPLTAAETTTPPGLVGHWAFDDGQGDVASDSSGNDSDGSLHGVEWVRGEFGTALRFKGVDSYVAIPQPGGLDGANELTVEAWVLWQGGGRYPKGNC